MAKNDKRDGKKEEVGSLASNRHDLLAKLEAEEEQRKVECQGKINFVLQEYGFILIPKMSAEYDPATGFTRTWVDGLALAPAQEAPKGT